jgi:hypothetical protein
VYKSVNDSTKLVGTVSSPDLLLDGNHLQDISCRGCHVLLQVVVMGTGFACQPCQLLWFQTCIRGISYMQFMSERLMDGSKLCITGEWGDNGGEDMVVGREDSARYVLLLREHGWERRSDTCIGCIDSPLLCRAIV